jgi:hypothetical protein
METRRTEDDRSGSAGRRSVLAAPLTRWNFPAAVGGLILYGAAALGVAAIGGWLGIAAALCLAALLVAVIVAAC